MTSNNPLGPFTFQGTCLNNPGDFFRTVGNNHHTIVNFKNQHYVFYHAEWLNKEAYGEQLGYRTTHVDVMPVNGDNFGNAQGTLTGVKQLEDVDPYELNHFYTSAWQAGIDVYGLGDTATFYNRGDWTGVSGVNFSKGAKSISVNGGSAKGATVRVSTGSPSGQVIGYITIPATGDNYKYTDVVADISGVTGKQDLFFVASGDVVLNNYKFSP